jgi:hypothetical protein
MMTHSKKEGIGGSLLEGTVPILYTFGAGKEPIKDNFIKQIAGDAPKK